MTDGKIAPRITGILETAIYVDDLDRAARFYLDLFAFPVLVRDSRFCAFDVAGRQVLLLFKKGATLQPVTLDGGTIPPHDGSGTAHFAFSISNEDLADWRTRLAAHRIPLTGDVKWERGGTSIYFDDPDGHVVELATPGIWATY